MTLNSVSTVTKSKSNYSFCIRPSGTEPKIKFYFGVKEETVEESAQVLQALKNAVMVKVKETVKF